MNNTLSTISKFLMVVIGCLIVYYLMSLAGNSKKMMQGFARQQESSAQVKELSRQVTRLEDKIEALKSGVDRKAEDYVTEKEVAAEILSSNNEIKSASNENKEKLNQLTRVITENKKQLEKYNNILNEADERISAVSENVANLQLGDSADFKVSYPVKDKFNIANEEKIGQLQDALEKVTAVNADLKEELAKVSVTIKDMESSVTVNKLVAENRQGDNIAGSLVETFKKSVDVITAASEKSLREMEKKYASFSEGGKEITAELEKKVSLIQQKLADVTKADTIDIDRFQQDLVQLKKDVANRIIVQYKQDLVQLKRDVANKITVQYKQDLVQLKRDVTNKITVQYKQDLAQLKRDVANKIVGQYQQVAEGMENDLEVLSEKFNNYKEKSAGSWGAIEVKLQNLQQNVAGVVDSKVEKLAGQLKVQLAQLDKEYAGLKESIASIKTVKEEPLKSEPVGILVTKRFDKTLILIKTAQGSFVFNPYKDFTGVVRVRDLNGDETMIRVPYTGEYLKVSSSMLDDGPFARSCVLGINCNLEARGSFSGKLKVE